MKLDVVEKAQPHDVFATLALFGAVEELALLDQKLPSNDLVLRTGIARNGDFPDVKKMISILGIKKVAAIFRKQISGQRINYFPEIKNYFELYFKKYA